MCILIHHPKDACFSSEQLKDFYYKNSDGFGAIVNHGDERGVVVYKAVGTLKEIEDLYYDKVACYEAIIHFRMKTHGDIDMENCHPYEVIKDEMWLAHNGILSYGNKENPKMSDTWHYIKDFIKPMLEQTPDALANPYIRGYIGSHIGSSNKFGLMDSKGNVFIVNKHAGVTYDGIWYSNTYAWTPWKFGYGEAPKSYYSGTGHSLYPTKTSSDNPYSKASDPVGKKHHYGSSKSWQLWNDMDDEVDAWEAEGYVSPSTLADEKTKDSYQRYQQALEYDRKATSQSNKAKRNKKKPNAKGKGNAARQARTMTEAQKVAKAKANAGQVTSPFVSTEVLARIIRSCYNAMMTEDYHGVVRWVSENPMKCATLLYELYGDEGPNSKWSSEVISDRVATDAEWGADAIVDMWAENEGLLLEMADITKPNTSKGVHSYVQ